MNRYKNFITLGTVLTALLLSHRVSFGAGLEITQTSASGLGYAFAGRATSVEDPSVVYNNPAGMVFRKGSSVSLAGYLVPTKITFKDNGSASLNQNRPSLGGGNGQSDRQSIVTNVYLHTKIKGFHIGFAANSPFGSNIDYGTTWVGRYHIGKIFTRAINYNFATAYQVNPKLSLGFGISYQTFDVELIRAIDLRSRSGGVITNDGISKITGDSAAFGYNFGLIYDLNPNSRLGFTYRSEVTQDISDAKADFELGAVESAGNIGVILARDFADTKANLKNTLPAQATLGLRQYLSTQLTLYTDLTWTGWSSIDKLSIDFDSSLSDLVTTLNLKDSLRLSVGTGYALSDKTLLRFGIAYDQSSVDKDRDPKIPDNDRIWLSLGAQQKFPNNIEAEFGYAHIITADANSNKTLEGDVNHQLKGQYAIETSVIGAGLNWHF